MSDINPTLQQTGNEIHKSSQIRSSSVGIGTGLRAGQLRNDRSIAGWEKRYLCPPERSSHALRSIQTLFNG